MSVSISLIRVGERHRKEFGDLDSLAQSIRDVGLLQPIGVTRDGELVFGERRLRACRDILGLTEVDVRIVNVPSIAAGEYHENEVRKDLTPSERVAISDKVRGKMAAGRASAPTSPSPRSASARGALPARTAIACGLTAGIDTSASRSGPKSEVTVSCRKAWPAAAKPESGTETLPEDDEDEDDGEGLVHSRAQVPPGQKTRDFAAKAAGFGSREEYRRAKSVVEHGIPDLVAAMDAGEVSISAAAAIAKLPPEQQGDRLHHRVQGTGDNEWYTPPEYVAAARAVLGSIDVDPATSVQAQPIIRAKTFYTAEDDGLKQEWHGRVWLNPPYAQPLIAHFVDKLLAEIEAGRVTSAILLTHNYTDTAWFQAAARRATAICFTPGRVRFVNADGREAAPTQGQAFFYFGNYLAAFHTEFGTAGFIR